MSNELQPYTAPKLPALSLDEDQTSLTSINRDTPEGQIAYYNAMIGEAKSMREMVNMKLMVKEALIHHVDRVDNETGEVGTGIRVVLVCTDGSVVHCQSSGILKTLKIIASTVGPLPWPKGREVVIKQKPIDNGKVWMYLELTQEEIARFLKEKRSK